MALRVIFMGTPEFAVPALKRIMAAGHDVLACYTQPPRPAGRGMGEKRSAVHDAADVHGLPVSTPKSLRSKATQTAFANFKADVAVVAAYGLILPPYILAAPAHGCLNIHASLLPRWRGAAPIQRAIMAGDRETGVMIMRMDKGLDTGPICMAERIPIDPENTAGRLHDTLAHLGGDLIVRALGALERGALDCTPQSEDGVTYAEKVNKAETRIDWTQPATRVRDHIRGLSPYPGAWFEYTHRGRRERIKVLFARLAELGPGYGTPAANPGLVVDDRLTISCAEGAVQLVRLQRAGKAPMDANAFLRGMALRPGSQVG